VTAAGGGDITGLVYEQDCNDPDNPLPQWMCHEVPKALLPPDYPYYVGHDEPLLEVFSNTPGSGNNVQWKMKLPNTDPVPTQTGTVVANRELYPAFWFSMALCDPQSTPFGACTPNSDSNTSAAGSAILELQFYPPGSNCPGDDSKWCAALTIDELTTNCGEPITAAPITTNGTPGGTRFLMSPGDSILITIQDTPQGLRTDVNDLTSATAGFMVASTANNFTQTLETTHLPLPMPIPPGTCSTTAHAYHPEYLTALPANQGSWINDNISFSFEIGHFELCGDAGCATKPDADADDTGCGTFLGVGGCQGQDNDHDGTPYLADWPDGTASHPSTLILGNPADNGFGPFSFSGGTYSAPFNQIFIQNVTLGGAFYPFYSKAGTGTSCVFNFGNDIPGTTTNDFGKTAQYNTIFPNLCAGSPPSISKSFGAATIPLGQSTSLTFTITNPNTTLDLTGVAFTDNLPGGLQVVGSISGSGCGAFVTGGLPNSINMSKISVAHGGTCTLTATVTGLTPGVKNNATGTISAAESASTGSAAAASITVVAPPMITKNFGAASIPLGQSTTLTFTITNPNSTVALAGVGFGDTLPGGLVVSTPNGLNPPTGCNGTVPTAVSGSNSISLTNASLPASASCTFSINVTGTTAGAKTNTTSNVTSTNGGPGNTASANLAVLAPPTITKSFADAEVQLFSGITALSFTISNPPANTLPLTGVGFVDNLPAGLIVLAPDNGLTGSCFGGTITAVPGSSSISLTGATLPVNASCTFSVLVNGAQIGVWTNTTNPVTSTNGGTGLPATATTSVDDLFFFWFFAA
jgi:uncharacterized repeat protein (TIGR01451 family)